MSGADYTIEIDANLEVNVKKRIRDEGMRCYTGRGLITQEHCFGDYRKMFADEWRHNKNRNVCWTYHQAARGLMVFNADEMEEQILQWNDLVHKGKLRCAEENKTTLEVDGKTWYVFTIQETEPNGVVSESNPSDSYALLLGGYMAYGYVYWFELEEARNISFHMINSVLQPKKGKQIEIMEVYKCNKDCAPKEMIVARTWWARFGYHYPCHCAHQKRQEKMEKDLHLAIKAEEETRRIANELLASEAQERKKKDKERKPSPPKEECPLTPNELKAIPARPAKSYRQWPSGVLIDNTKKQQEWDAKYGMYKKWIK